MGCSQSKAEVASPTGDKAKKKKLSKTEKLEKNRLSNLKEMKKNKRLGKTPEGHGPYKLPRLGREHEIIAVPPGGMGSTCLISA